MAGVPTETVALISGLTGVMGVFIKQALDMIAYRWKIGSKTTASFQNYLIADVERLRREVDSLKRHFDECDDDRHELRKEIGRLKAAIGS
jgi:cell division protein FtsB